MGAFQHLPKTLVLERSPTGIRLRCQPGRSGELAGYHEDASFIFDDGVPRHK